MILLLALHSGISPGGTQETVWDLGIEPKSALCKASILSTPALELSFRRP